MCWDHKVNLLEFSPGDKNKFVISSQGILPMVIILALGLLPLTLQLRPFSLVHVFSKSYNFEIAECHT